MDDMISRQAAIDGKISVQRTNGVEIYSDDVVPVKYLENLPSAQTEPKRGKWIKYEQEFMLEEPFKTVQKTVRECSICTTKIAGMVGIMNFCPNCGADMRLGEQDG